MRKLALFLALPLAFWATTASAAITTFSNESAWQTAVGVFFTEPFNNAGLQPFTFASSDAGAILNDKWRDRVTPGVNGDITVFSYIPSVLKGAGGTWDTSPAGEGTALLITLNMTGGGTQTVGQIGPINGFFGWTSTLAFDSFTISAGNISAGSETFDLDNLHFAPGGDQPAAVPEPTTLVLFGTGLAGLRFLRRKRAQQTE